MLQPGDICSNGEQLLRSEVIIVKDKAGARLDVKASLAELVDFDLNRISLRAHMKGSN